MQLSNNSWTHEKHCFGDNKIMDNLKKTCSPVIIQYKVFKQQKFGFYSLNNIVTAVTMRRMCISVKKNEKNKRKNLFRSSYMFSLILQSLCHKT